MVLFDAMAVLSVLLSASLVNTKPKQDLPKFTPVSLKQQSLSYFDSYGATQIKGIQFIDNPTQRKDISNNIANRTQVVVALNASKEPVRFLEITEDSSNRHEVSFLSNIGFGSVLKKTRIGLSPGGILVLPQYKGANVQEVKSADSIKSLQIFGNEYLRSAAFDNKLLLMTTSSIKLIDYNDVSQGSQVLADAKMLNSGNLEDVSLEFVEDYDCIVQIGKRLNSPEYVVQLFDLKSTAGKVRLNRKHTVSLPVEILRSKPLNKDLSRLVATTQKEVIEFRWDRTDSFTRHSLNLRTTDGNRITGINHVLVEDNLVFFGTDTGVYYSSMWDESDSMIIVQKVTGCKSAKVSQLALSKSDYLVVGYTITKTNNHLIAIWKMNRL